MSVFKVGSNKSSQNNFPSVRPTLDLDFANSKTLDPRITFTRSSGGSYVGADGLIKYAGVNEPRFDHDPVTGESLGFLVEESRSNSTLHSQNLSNASWNKSNCNSTSNDAIAPDGTLTATKITTEANDNGGVVVNQVYTSTQNPVSFTYSIFAKAGTYRYIAIQGFVSVWSHTVVFDLQTGTIFTPSNYIGSKIAQIVSYGNGWYRCSVTYPAYFYYYFQFQFALTSYVGGSDNGIYDNTVSPTAGQFIYVWGAQLEAGAFPTSYIPTVASSRTRAADFASITGKNFSSWYNQSGGSVYLEDKMLNKSLDSTTAVGFLGPSNDYRILLFRNYAGATDQFEIYHNGQQAAFNISRTVNQYHKVAVSFKQNDIALSFDGQTPVVDTSATIPPVDRLEFASNYGTSFIVEYTGTIKRLTYYPKRLTNQQLQVLTR